MGACTSSNSGTDPDIYRKTKNDAEISSAGATNGQSASDISMQSDDAPLADIGTPVSTKFNLKQNEEVSDSLSGKLERKSVRIVDPDQHPDPPLPPEKEKELTSNRDSSKETAPIPDLPSENKDGNFFEKAVEEREALDEEKEEEEDDFIEEPETIAVEYFPGFVVKTKRTIGTKVFFNVCQSPNVASMVICSPCIALDNKGVDCVTYDCVLTEETYRRFASSDKKIALLEMCSLIQDQITRQYKDEFVSDFNVLAKKTYMGDPKDTIEIPFNKFNTEMKKMERQRLRDEFRRSRSFIDQSGGEVLWTTPPQVCKGILLKQQLLSTGLHGGIHPRQFVLSGGYLTYFEEANHKSPPYGRKLKTRLLLYGYEVISRGQMEEKGFYLDSESDVDGGYMGALRKMNEPDCSYDICLVRPESAKLSMNVQQLGPAYMEQSSIMLLQLEEQSEDKEEGAAKKAVVDLAQWKKSLIEHAMFADRLVKERGKQNVEGLQIDPGDVVKMTPESAKHLIYVREGGLLLHYGVCIKSSGIGLGKEDVRLVLFIHYPSRSLSHLVYIDAETMQVKGTMVMANLTPVDVVRGTRANSFRVEGMVEREDDWVKNVVTKMRPNTKLEKRCIDFKTTDGSPVDRWINLLRNGHRQGKGA